MGNSLGGADATMLDIFDPELPQVVNGRCYAKDTTPAVIETVTEEVFVAPASYNPDGSLYAPERYKTITNPVIIKDREELQFETPCPQLLTVERTSTLQRALKARGYFYGPVNGKMDFVTKTAIRKFQKERGTDSSYLTMHTAQILGVIEYHREDLDNG